MRVKRILALLAVICMLTTGCGKDKINSSEDINISEPTVATSEDTSEEATEATTEGATEENTDVTEEATGETTEETTEATQTATEGQQPTEAKTEKPTEAKKGDGTFTSSDMKFSYGGANVTVTSDAAPLIAALGKPKDKEYIENCYTGEKHAQYTYDAIKIFTYPSDNKELINEIRILNNTLPTPKGLKVGMTLSEAEAIYGKVHKVVGKLYCYYASEDDTSTYMYLELSGDKIKVIGYIVEFESSEQ